MAQREKMWWEYRIIEYSFGVYNKDKPPEADELNKLGDEGWELVSAFQAVSGYGKGLGAILIFKRPKA
jgi:hypothetical protein